MRTRKQKKVILITVAGVVIATSLTSSVWYASAKHYNAKLLSERDAFQKALAAKDDKLQQYQKQARVGYVFTTDKNAGDTILQSDIQQRTLPDYFTPENVISKKEDIVGKVIKLKSLKSTTITTEMVYANGNLDPSQRKEEVDFVKLPIRIAKNDTVDIHIVFPDGEDFIVLAKKKLTDVDVDAQRMFFEDNAEETLLLQSALYDAYINNAELYAKQYSEPEMQPAPAITYIPNNDVQRAIKANPAIVDQARYTYAATLRQSLDDRMKKFDTTKPRIGAEDPQGSGVSRRKKVIGAGASTAKPNDTNTANNQNQSSATVMQPNSSNGTSGNNSGSNLLGGK